MVAGAIRKTSGRDRARKPAGRRARGVQAIERAGFWHAVGTLRAGGRSIRVRQSLGLAVDRTTLDQAEEAARDLEAEIRARATGKVGRGGLVSVAAEDYVKAPRDRPLRPSTIIIIQEIVGQFRARRLNEIAAAEWIDWIDGNPEAKIVGRMAGNKSATRERFVGGVVAFLNFCKLKHGLAALPEFTRDRKATNPTRRARRRVEDLRPDLIRTLLDQAHISIRAQLIVECDTGARVSSVLHGARICDLNLAPGRETITFRNTKTGHDVAAALSPTAATILKEYLKWRGGLRDREAPLFLTRLREPYADNGGAYGTQNKTGFNAAKLRAQAAVREAGAKAAAAARRRGDRAAAADAIAAAKADAALLGKVTQHWFRHRMATIWLRKDPRAAMDQGGWRTIISVMGYAHSTPEYRQRLVAEVDELAPPAAAPARRSARRVGSR